MTFKYIVLFAAVCGLAIGRITEIKPCPGMPEGICEVTEARILPCPGDQDEIKSPCRLKKGRDGTISFDFVPHFTARNLTTNVFYTLPSGQKQTFSGFGSSNACEFTKCPTESGVSQTMNYALHVGKKLPQGTFPFEWKVWNVDNEAEVCCFIPTVRLVK